MVAPSVPKPSRLVRACEWLLRLAASPLSRWLTRGLCRMALAFRWIAPGDRLERAVLAFIRMEAACCRSSTPHFKLMARHIERFQRAGTFARMRRFLRAEDPARAARRLDAWLRMGCFVMLRHEILGRRLATPGVPPTLLTQAQLALSPGCDLSCEGCFTAEDRGGVTPRRDDIAHLVDQAAACGAFIIHVIGKGEPFLSRAWASELLDVIEARPHIFFTVATHGMRIDAALAERLGNIGNLLLLVSVDGPEPIHDARRGAGSYARIHEVFALLREYRVSFGFSCMVSQKSHAALTAPEFIAAQAAAGCVIGIYSRYFPLSSTSVRDLELGPAALASYLAAFDRALPAAPIPLFDLDEVERHSGCHSRAGQSVYIDGITGQVAPCLRVPFAPADCRVDRAAGLDLASALSHPFFTDYRQKKGGCPSTCGANLDGELASIGRLLDDHGERPVVLAGYQERAVGSARRRLPLLPSQGHP